MDQGKGRALGAILAESEMVSPSDIEKALAEQRRSGVRIGEALVNLGIVTAEDVRWGLAQQLNIPFVHVRTELIDPEAVRIVPEDVARRYRLIPYLLIGDELTVIVEDPTSKRAIADLENITSKHLTIAVGLAQEIEKALAEVYGPGRVDGVPAEDLVTELFDEQQQLVIRGDYSGEAFLQVLFQEAEKRRATSIHFEPRRDTLLVRLRAAGKMTTAAQLSRAWARGILQRLKASLFDLERRPGACEGYYSFEIDGRKNVYHVSCVETVNGAAATVVNLTPADFPAALNTLPNFAAVSAALSHADGLIVFLGPERPEKYRLLDLLLRAKNADTKKTIIVGRMPWFVDTGYIQLRPAAERWEELLEVLHVAVRQEPDLLAVEDLTQPRLFNAVLGASLSSFSTFGGLHFASISTGLEFMIEAAENRTLLCAVLRGFINYAVLPKLCPACKKPDDRESLAARLFGLSHDAPLRSLRQAQGCEQCGGAGYQGIHLLLESLAMDETIAALIKSGEPLTKILPLIAARNENSLIAQAQTLALAGETPLDDVATLMGNGNRGAN